ncbi:MAG TPA: glycosyltransferase family 39 protein [Anaerolineae bacterium]|nr:glycosyltransferase family 39 protein [Anaerolineae bacterium]HQK12820.1 glycosyltransferase family 39 protein [Anaerolineae bacterium]
MDEEINLEELAPWLLILITLIGGGLRVLLLDHQGMWLDETFSVWLANRGVGDLLRWVARIDQHPPLYYLLLHYWIALNGDTTPYTVRLLSVLFGIGAIPTVYLIGKRMSGAVMGLVAAMLMALSPFHIRFAQETRMYTLLTFNAAVAIYALVRLLTDSRTIAPIGSQVREYLRLRHWSAIRTIETDLAWGIFIAFSVATMFTHNTAVLFPLATNLFVLGLMFFQRVGKSGALSTFQVPPFKNWVKAQIAILVLWSPWSVAFIRQARGVYQEFWIPKPDWNTVIQVLKSFLNAPTPAPGQTNQGQMIWLLYVVVLGLGMWHYRKKMAHFLFLAALFAVPFLGELIVSIRRPIFYDRTLIWITIPLFLALAAGVTQLKFRFLILVAVGILGTNNLFAAADYYRFTQKEDWRTAAGYVANFAQKGDLVLFNATWVQIPFDYYFHAYENQYAIQIEKRGAPVDLFDSGVVEPKMTERDIPRLLSLIDGRQRVWLVYSHDWYTDPQGLIPQTLASKMRLTRQRDFYGGRVQLYEAP